MINHMVQLTKEQYTILDPMGHNAQTDELINNVLSSEFLSKYNVCGHASPFEDDGNYYIQLIISKRNNK